MMKLFLGLCLFIHFVTQSYGQNQVNLKCDYEDHNFTFHSTKKELASAFSCVVINKIIYNGYGQVNINDFKDDQKVKGFSADHKILYTIPHAIGRRFQNIEFLSIRFSKLKMITKKDLENFKKIKLLDLSWNELKFLEGNLFKNNPDLVTVLLNSNEIYFIVVNAINSLKSLKYLNLDKNACYSGEARNQTSAVKLISSNTCRDELPANMMEKRYGNDGEAQLEGKISNLSDLIRNFKEEFSRESSKSDKKIEGIIERMSSYRIKNLSMEIQRIFNEALTDFKNESIANREKINRLISDEKDQNVLLILILVGVSIVLIILTIQSFVKIFYKRKPTKQQTVTYAALNKQENPVMDDNGCIYRADLNEKSFSCEALGEVAKEENVYQEIPEDANSESLSHDSEDGYEEIHKNRLYYQSI